MDGKIMNLGRAKKKLRYFQSEESNECQLKIKDVFSMQELDNIFDDLDSEPGTPLLSPLPKSPGLDDQNKRRQDRASKSPVAFRGQISPLKGSDVLAAETDIQMDHLNDKGSPFEEIAPIKTSSPIELLAVEGTAEEVEKPETAPLLFGIEDEEPVVGVLTKSQMHQRLPKDVPNGSSESWPSPPTQLEFGKPRKKNDPVTKSTLQKEPETQDQVCRTSAPEPEEESQTNGSVSLSPIAVIKECQPKPTPKAQHEKQAQEVAVEVGAKQSLFQKMLRNAFQPKASGFRKQEALKQPARAPSPHVHEEDFMILEDDCPIHFTIPRKPEIKEKTAPDSTSVELDPKEKASPKQPKDPKNEPKKKTKAKHGKANDLAIQDTAVKSAPESRKPELNEDVGGGKPSSFSPDINQDADIPVTGKQKPKGRISKPDQHDGKSENNGGVKIPAEKPTAKTNKSAKLLASINPGQAEPLSNVKKKVTKIKSAIKADIPESAGLDVPRARNQERSLVKNKILAKEQEQRADVQNHTELPPEPADQPEDQIASGANKEPASKQHAPKKPGKVKKTEKTKDTLEINKLAVPDASAEVSAASKRKRKPPGDWWLTQQNENDMLVQPEAVRPSQKLKSKKTQRKAPVLTDLNEQELVTSSQEIPATVQKLPQTLKKSQANKAQCNPAGLPKNHRSASGRRKQKSGAQDQREMTPALIDGEESGDNEASGQLSPLACSQLPRQHSENTPGDKRVFDRTYMRESLSRSAQKRPPVLHNAPESVPVKRQRKPPQNWWEVPQSQELVEDSDSPRKSASESSRQLVGPLQSAFPQRASLKKSAGCGWGRKKIAMTNTPKSVRRSLATLGAKNNSAKLSPTSERGRGARQKGRRNLLHSLEDHSEPSTEYVPSDCQQQASSHATFDVSKSGESSVAWRKTNPRTSNVSNRALDYDTALKSGPSSLIELERFELDEDIDLPSSRISTQKQCMARVLSNCDLCGPPLKPIVLDNEDWDNLCVWFTHIWPTTSKDSKAISPDDFHWHCHAGRAMGHMVDLQNNTFSNGKILLGSYMKKPVQVDLKAVTVFNVASSCVRVEIDGVKEVYNSGQTFMIPCGQSYSIHNMCQEPAILWYHRMLSYHTQT